MEEIKKKARNLEVNLRIGKAGINDSVVNEIRLQLKKKKLVKIKMLKSFALGTDKKKTAEEIALLTKSKLVSVIGNVFVLYKQ